MVVHSLPNQSTSQEDISLNNISVNDISLNDVSRNTFFTERRFQIHVQSTLTYCTKFSQIYSIVCQRYEQKEHITYVVRATPAVGCVRVRVVCWVGNGSRDLPKGSSMGATLAFRRTGMCIAPPTWHMRCAAWYYKYRCMLFCNPSSRESGTLVITESFGLRHQEEPCACGEPRVSPDNTYNKQNQVDKGNVVLLMPVLGIVNA